jgi:hypothetical protein
MRMGREEVMRMGRERDHAWGEGKGAMRMGRERGQGGGKGKVP